MKCVRNLILVSLTALALLLPIASSFQSRAEAGHGQQRVYWVFYRANASSPWVCYGGYYTEHDANRTLGYLSNLGYDTFYR